MHTSIRLLLAFFFLSFSAGAQIPEGWEWQNPLPHGLTIYDIVMLDESNAIAACENGYIMLSNNGGVSWTPLRIAGGHINNISALGPHNVWVATAEGSILHSSDYGRTWETQLSLETTQTGAGRIRMYDELRGMAILPRDLVYRTSDGGATWEQLPRPYFGQDYGRWLSAQSASTWYIMGAIGSSPRLYITTDFGSTWQEDTLLTTRGLNNLVYIDPQYGFQCRNGGLLRTTNGGLSWTEMDVFGFGYVLNVVAGEHLGNRIFALSDGGVVANASYDNGESWNVSLLENAFGYAAPTGIAFASPAVGLVVGSGGRILRTTDSGQSWNIVHGIGFLGHIIDLAFTTPENGLALSSSSTILLTSNGGERWIETSPVPDVTLQKVSMYNESSGFAYGSNGSGSYIMYHTSDFGQTWEQRGTAYEVTTNERYTIPQDLDAFDASRVYLGVSYGRLFRSTDGGMTYDSLELPPDLKNQYYSAMKVQTFALDHVTLIASNGIGQSTDGGDSWIFHRVQSSQWLNACVFTSPTQGFAIQNGRFSRTTNGGAAWELSENENNVLIHFFNEFEGVMYSSQFQDDPFIASVKRTSNGGNSWTEHSLRESVSWDDWFWHGPVNGWAYGYAGMIRHTSSSGVVGTAPIANAPASIVLHASYPNPVSLSQHGGVSIEFTIGESAGLPLRATLHDVLGRSLLTLERYVAPGRNILTVPFSAFRVQAPVSSVFLTLTHGTQRITRRIAVMQ